MADPNIKEPQINIPDVDLTLAERQATVESCVTQLTRNGVTKLNAFAISTASISGIKKHSEVKEIVKTFKEIDKSFTGITSKAGKKKHTHDYALLILNGGERLLGTTTSTNGEKGHVHQINLVLDNRIRTIEAYTNYNYSNDYAAIVGIPTEEDDSIAAHQHLFKTNIEDIMKEIGSTWIFCDNDGNIIDEKKFMEFARGEGQGVGGAKQGDGGTDKCYCPECGHSMTHTRGTACTSMKCSKCGATMTGVKLSEPIIAGNLSNDGKGHYSFSNSRQASILLSRVAQLEQPPVWFRGSLDTLQSTVVDSVIKEFGEVYFEGNIDSCTTEMVISLADKGKLDPKAKIRNRGDAILPANSKDVTDNKDHFPQNSSSQAKNALARVAQYDKVPSWYKGTLQQLQRKVKAAVKKKYPSISVKGLSEYYAIRLKEEGDLFFLYLTTENENTAKNDCSIYFKERPNARVDLVKFRVNYENESCQFSEVGNILLYEIAKVTHSISSEPIKLSERDADGNVVIEILREGNFNHEVYGNFAVTNDLMQEMIKNFDDNVLAREIAFDMNHIVTLPAAAWARKLSTGKKLINGQPKIILNAHVKPTPLGETAIRNKEYMYFSSEYTENFVDKETGKEYGAVLKGGGLTNRPWIPGLAPIQLSEIKDGICISSNNH